MSYALVDNATLTGVQRLLGEIPLRSRDVVDADIGALENLIHAILFFDYVVAIDDYKEEFREARRSRFNFVRFLDPTNYGLPDVIAATETATRALEPTISGGEFSDGDLRPLLDRLRMHIICTWDMASSVYYLTMRLLGAPDDEELSKYSRLQSAIFGELQDLFDSGGRYDPTAKLVDSQGRLIPEGASLFRDDKAWPTGGMSKQLQAFIASLRWLAYRTTFCSLAAEYLRADLLLYPVRQAYHLHFMERTARYSADFVSAVVQTLSKRVTESIEAVIAVNRQTRIAMSIPIFSAWLVNRTGDVRQVIPAALEIRQDTDIVAAREQFREIRNLLDDGSVPEASKRVQGLIRELDAVLATIRARYGLKTPQGPTIADATRVIMPLIGAQQFPEIGKSTSLLPLWLRERWPRKGVGAVYRDVARDLTMYPRLGRIRDMLGAAVDVETNNARSTRPKVEDPRNRGRAYWWKMPM